MFSFKRIKPWLLLELNRYAIALPVYVSEYVLMSILMATGRANARRSYRRWSVNLSSVRMSLLRHRASLLLPLHASVCSACVVHVTLSATHHSGLYIRLMLSALHLWV